MIVTSKFRAFYIAKYVLIYSLMLAFSIGAFFSTLKNKENSPFLVVTLVFSAVVIVTSLEFLNLSKLTINSDGIKNYSIFFKKTTFISYSEIENLNSERMRIKSKGGYINDGYTRATINLKTGSTLIISQDCYENYEELITAFFQYYKS